MAAQLVSGYLAIAIDLGGTQIRAGIVDETGRIHRREAVRTQSDSNAEIVIAQIVSLIAQVTAGVSPTMIAGIGMSSPGPIDTSTGETLGLPSIKGFEDYALRTVLSERLGRPVALENDGISAVIGEWQLGAGKDFANIVYVTVSTGVGGGVIVDNRVMRGRRGMAGHVGHMSIVPHGERCGCGNLGCWEAYASATNFTKRAKAAGAGDDAAKVFEAARAGNRLALKLVAEQAEYLAQGFVSLMHLFSPDVLIMGGGMSQQFDLLQDPIMEHVSTYAMKPFQGCRIVPAALGTDSGLIGASRLVFMG